MSGRMIFAGGPIRTMASPATVEAVRVDGRRITAVGSLADLRSLGEADMFDLDGRCLMPGFVDAHTHPLMHGQCMSWADLSTATSMDEVVKLLREHARGLAAGAATRGFGYDQHRLCEDRHPTAVELDRVARDRPVVIMHTSGHGYVANSYALAEAAITADTPTPLGGLIDRDDDGNPVGRVFDAACDLLTGPRGVKIANHGPNFHLPDEPEALDARLDEAQEAFLAAGITTVGDCQVTSREMTNYLRARNAGRLRIRVSMHVLSSHADSLWQLGVDARKSPTTTATELSSHADSLWQLGVDAGKSPTTTATEPSSHADSLWQLGVDAGKSPTTTATEPSSHADSLWQLGVDAGKSPTTTATEPSSHADSLWQLGGRRREVTNHHGDRAVEPRGQPVAAGGRLHAR